MVQSPCINICKMDEASGLCLGCFRTLDEIAGWAASPDPVRLEILARVEKRRQEQEPRSNCEDGRS